MNQQMLDRRKTQAIGITDAGLGSYALEFARAGCRVTAMDASRECLDVLKTRAAQCGFTIETEQVESADSAAKVAIMLIFVAVIAAIVVPVIRNRKKSDGKTAGNA